MLTAMIFGGAWYGREEVLGYKYQMVAQNLNVDLSTVWRVMKLFQNFGSVEKKHYSQSVSQKLTPPLELYFIAFS